MAKFKSSEQVDKMEFDFEDHGGPKGLIPEPSQDTVKDFKREVKSIVKDLTGDDIDLDDEKAVRKRLQEITDEAEDRSDGRMAAAYAALCGNAITVDEIKALPFRVQAAFFGWVQGQLTDPEPSTSATKPSLRAVSGG